MTNNEINTIDEESNVVARLAKESREREIAAKMFQPEMQKFEQLLETEANIIEKTKEEGYVTAPVFWGLEVVEIIYIAVLFSLVLLVLFFIWCCCCKRRSKKQNVRCIV